MKEATELLIIETDKSSVSEVLLELASLSAKEAKERQALTLPFRRLSDGTEESKILEDWYRNFAALRALTPKLQSSALEKLMEVHHSTIKSGEFFANICTYCRQVRQHVGKLLSAKMISAQTAATVRQLASRVRSLGKQIHRTKLNVMRRPIHIAIPIVGAANDVTEYIEMAKRHMVTTFVFIASELAKKYHWHTQINGKPGEDDYSLLYRPSEEESSTPEQTVSLTCLDGDDSFYGLQGLMPQEIALKSAFVLPSKRRLIAPVAYGYFADNVKVLINMVDLLGILKKPIKQVATSFAKIDAIPGSAEEERYYLPANPLVRHSEWPKLREGMVAFKRAVQDKEASIGKPVTKFLHQAIKVVEAQMKQMERDSKRPGADQLRVRLLSFSCNAQLQDRETIYACLEQAMLATHMDCITLLCERYHWKLELLDGSPEEFAYRATPPFKGEPIVFGSPRSAQPKQQASA